MERVWLRVQTFPLQAPEKIVLRPRQAQLVQLLAERGGLAPAEMWDALGISRQAAMKLLRPLMDAGLVEKVGSKKTGRYRLQKND